ncbi:MAG: hypothetical protein KJN97_02300, partial [Deltaproteobacteria bacterium]|nr:hypothetical protein [Deltaproteobacteria bacterium]
MPGRLVDQLVVAGLVTEVQARASDAGDPQVPSGQVVQSLVSQGLDEHSLAGFFVNLGFGPMLRACDLAGADAGLVRRLPGAVARDLCAMPLRPSRVGAIVAMADPTDERSVAKLSELLGGSILPTVAKLSDLLESIDLAYPAEQPTPAVDPLALARARSATPTGAVPLVNAKPTSGTEKTVPSFEASLSELVSKASPVWDRAWNKTAPTRDVSLTPKATHVPLPRISTTLTPHAFAPPSNTPHPATPGSKPASSSPPSAPHGRSNPPPASASDPAIAAQLDELAQASSRDEVVRVACEACLAAARGAAFLALRKGVFRGWDGAGDEVTSAGIRSLWIPATNPS